MNHARPVGSRFVTEPSVWAGWALLALADLPAGRADSELAVIVQVAVRFADRFAPEDRAYIGVRPGWHGRVAKALTQLRSEGLISAEGTFELTETGRARAAVLRENLTPVGPDPRASDGKESAGGDHAEQGDDRLPLINSGVIAPALRSVAARKKIGFISDEDVPIPVMAELNLRFTGGPRAAFERLEDLWVLVTGDRRPSPIAEQYASGMLSMNEIERLVAADAAPVLWPTRCLRRVWPDFPVKLHVDRSCVTVKADAARRSFNAYGEGIVWAVIDSGISEHHPHFEKYETLHHSDVEDLHRFFPTQGDPTPEGALKDESGHGTHVAGIIAGGIQPWLDEEPGRLVRVTENRYNVKNPTEPLRVPRERADVTLLAGMAPKARLVSLKVLAGGGSLNDRVSRVIRALAYVREVNGSSVEGMRIHGVNLSVGYEFDPQWFACGQSPLCAEVDKLVRSGVVVVVAAGNSGYGTLNVKFEAPSKFGLGMTINDPGNAERAITVGSTHRDAPHTYGVSYFSSKGPTGDGRGKPDLVAPGERITSCAAGAHLDAVVVPSEEATRTAVYVEDSGTSMAAPHVSGAVAALLSVRREFIGQPDKVKPIILDSATSLRREKDFQGSGLLDMMRALHSI
jgi:serine protease AprX